MSFKRILDEEITNELNELKKISVGTEEHKASVDALTKLMDRKIELEKLEVESKTQDLNRDIETNLRLQQMESEKRDRLIKNVLTGVSTVGGLLCAGLAFIASINFEKEGTLTTEGGRSALRQLLKFR